MDVTKFMKQEFSARTETVQVPSLAEWFEGDPVFEIRGLTGSELVSTNEAADKNKNLAAIIETLATGLQNDKIGAFKELAGVSDDVPAELIRRIEILINGTVSPVVDRPFAVKLAEHFPADFVIITNKIRILTGQGSDVVKQKPSGETTK